MSEELFFVKSSERKKGAFKYEQSEITSLINYSEHSGFDVDIKQLEKKLKQGKKLLSLQEVEFIFDWSISEQEQPVFNLFEDEFIEMVNIRLQSFHLKLIWSLLEKSKVRAFWDLIHEYENISDVFYNEVYSEEEFKSLLNFVLSYSGMVSKFLFEQYYEKEAYQDLAEKNIKMLEALEFEDFENFQKAKKYFDHQSFEFLKDIQGIRELVQFRNEHLGESPLIIPPHLQRSETRESLMVQISDLVWIADRLKNLNEQNSGTVYLIHHY